MTEEEIEEAVQWARREGMLPDRSIDIGLREFLSTHRGERNMKYLPSRTQRINDAIKEDQKEADLNARIARLEQELERTKRVTGLSNEMENFLHKNASPMGRAFGQSIGQALAGFLVLTIIVSGYLLLVSGVLFHLFGH